MKPHTVYRHVLPVAEAVPTSTSHSARAEKTSISIPATVIRAEAPVFPNHGSIEVCSPAGPHGTEHRSCRERLLVWPSVSVEFAWEPGATGRQLLVLTACQPKRRMPSSQSRMQSTEAHRVASKARSLLNRSSNHSFSSRFQNYVRYQCFNQQIGTLKSRTGRERRSSMWPASCQLPSPKIQQPSLRSEKGHD